MRRRLWLCLSLFLFASLPIAISADTATGDLSSWLQSFNLRNRIPGLIAAIVSPNSINQIAIGKRDHQGHVAFSETPFLIGSVSKSMTALAIMQLRESGRLRLDAPIHDYLRNFVPGTQESEGITVRNLLNHTSGIPPVAGDGRAASLDEFVSSVHVTNQWRPPGSGFRYSNVNYDLLGAIVASVSGESYDDYMKEHVFSPLKMTSTYTRLQDAQANGSAKPFLWRFGWPRPAPLLYVPAGVPAAYIFSSASDLSHYVYMLVNGGTYSGKTIVTADSLNMMFHPSVSTPGGDSYGFGWYIRGAGAGRVVYHDGYAGGFAGTVLLQPDLHSGGALFMNIDGVFASELLLPQMKDFLAQASGPNRPETPPQTVPAFYLGIMLILAFATVLGILWFARALLRENTSRFRIAPLVWELGVPFCMLIYAPHRLLAVRNFPDFWRVAAVQYWDLAPWCLLICAIFLICFLLRAVRAIRLASPGHSTTR